MLQNFSIFKIIFNDAPQPWQLGFQDSACPGFTGIVELHNTIFFYLVVISVGVFWVLGSIIYYYNSEKSPIVHKYLNHGFKAQGLKGSIRNYSTTSKINVKIKILKEGSVKMVTLLKYHGLKQLLLKNRDPLKFISICLITYLK